MTELVVDALPVAVSTASQHRRENKIQSLGRLPKVDLIILEGEKCPSVRTSVRPQKVSSI